MALTRTPTKLLPMTRRTVIAGINPIRPGHADAIALGALLARLTDSDLTLACAFAAPADAAARADAEREHELALRRASLQLRERLEGLAVEHLALPGASAAEVLRELCAQRPTEALVIAAGSRATPGRAELGSVSKRVLDGASAPTAIAVRGFASRAQELREIGIAYAPGTPESDAALRYAARLAERAGAALRVLCAYDPSNRLLVREHSHSEGELAAHAEWVIGGGSEVRLSASLLEGDPVEVLSEAARALDLLLIGSHAREPHHVVLGGRTSGALLEGLDCTLLVVPLCSAVFTPKP